ncbi:MAG: hypothetical protein ABL955_01240 [Elusimicrobiota bacterium]
MKHMLLVMTLAVSPVAAHEFASDAPAVDAILAKTRALQAASAASHAHAKLLHDIEKTKGLIQKYGDDQLRAGIYKAELSLLQLKLALEVKHAGHPPAETIYRYDPKDLRFEKTEGEVKLIRVNDVLYKYNSIDVRHKGSIIATFHVYDPKIVWRGWETDIQLMKALESIRLSAAQRGLNVLLDYEALARRDGPGSWEPELLGEIIRTEKPL